MPRRELKLSAINSLRIPARLPSGRIKSQSAWKIPAAVSGDGITERPPFRKRLQTYYDETFGGIVRFAYATQKGGWNTFEMWVKGFSSTGLNVWNMFDTDRPLKK